MITVRLSPHLPRNYSAGDNLHLPPNERALPSQASASEHQLAEEQATLNPNTTLTLCTRNTFHLPVKATFLKAQCRVKRKRET